MRSCVERYVYSVYILSLLLLFFVSFRFCRGSLNRSMCCCCWCTRSTSFAICRFVSSISYARAFTFAFIKNYGMRWNGTRDVNVGLTRSLSVSLCLCVYILRDAYYRCCSCGTTKCLDAFILLMGIAYRHDFKFFADASRNVARQFKRLLTHSHSHNVVRIQTTRQIWSHTCGLDLRKSWTSALLSLESLEDYKKWLRAHLFHWLCVFLIHDGSLSIAPCSISPIPKYRGQHKLNCVSDFPILHFPFKYLSTDDALNYPEPFFIRSQALCNRQMPSFHSSQLECRMFGV